MGTRPVCPDADDPDPEDLASRIDLPPHPEDLESTADLLAQVRENRPYARDRLLKRYIPDLTRLAHGRLPKQARGLVDTDDIVQSTLIRALDHVKDFEPEREGAFLAYLRRILFNAIIDEARRVKRTPASSPIREDLANHDRSPLEDAIGSETLRAYEAALERLTDQQRNAVVGRLEYGYGYGRLARELGSPSANAARMLVSRAMVRLAELMQEHGQE